MIYRPVFAIKWAFASIILLSIVGCGQKSDKDLIPIRPKLTGVSYEGGDGSSIENAVIIKAPNKLTGIRAEYDWMKKNRSDWQLDRQSVLKGQGKVLDKMYCITPDGQRTFLFFDVTDFYEKK
ncbi:MAG: hypothetical protein JW749_06815 [Sedimentisphaerales bacterium]|nr:hypothetical protein [Sedimentisphaerales bacterium]